MVLHRIFIELPGSKCLFYTKVKDKFELMFNYIICFHTFLGEFVIQVHRFFRITSRTAQQLKCSLLIMINVYKFIIYKLLKTEIRIFNDELISGTNLKLL